MSNKAKNTSGYKFHEDTPLQTVTGYFESDKITEKGQPFLVFETRMLQGVMPFGPQAGVITNDDLTSGVVEYLLKKTDSDGKTLLYAHLLVKDGSAKATKLVTPSPVTVNEDDATEHGEEDQDNNEASATVTASEAGGAKAKAKNVPGSKAGKKKPVKKVDKKVDDEDFN